MNDKEFVLVSQGIEIMRTQSQEKAINYVKKENDDWFDYKQKCIDNYEDYADNYIDLEIEYPSEKEKDKEIERLKNIINELEKYINKEFYVVGNSPKGSFYEGYDTCLIEMKQEILDKIKELKGGK